MWEYKITKTDMGFIIYRKKYVGKIMLLQFLNSNNLRTPNKSSARTFYNKDSAMSALVIMKAKKDESIEKPKEEEKEKQSRSDLQ